MTKKKFITLHTQREPGLDIPFPRCAMQMNKKASSTRQPEIFWQFLWVFKWFEKLWYTAMLLEKDLQNLPF